MSLELDTQQPNVVVAQLQDLLGRGIRTFRISYNADYVSWEETTVWRKRASGIATPHIWVSKLSLSQAVVVGAAAAVIKNPEVTRRFWAGWFE